MKLIVKKINKGFFKKVINNFSYEFENGKIYAITGKSGCGKSTLLSILAGNCQNYNGNIYFDKQNIKKMPNYTFLDVGFVYQSYQLLDNLTSYENVALPLEMQNEFNDNIKYKINTLFKKFNISNLLNTKVKNCSGGEKQRIAIIRALIKNPKIILLDEPTSALDARNSEILFEHLNTIKKDKIIIMVTHNQNIADKCDEIIDLNNINKVDLLNFKEIKKSQNKIKFHKIKFLYQKVFKNKKIYNYFATSILSIGLIGFLLVGLLTSFINSVVNNSFNIFNNKNNITIKMKKNEEHINYDYIEKTYNSIYYEGLESSFKKQIKDNSLIQKLYLNQYELSNINFIFDNYLSTYSENVVLAIPLELSSNLLVSNNIIKLELENKIIQFNIDKYEIVDLYQPLSIYCNNINYLDDYFKYLNIDKKTTNLFYANDIDKLYDFLNNNINYINYEFILDKNNHLIYIQESYYPRILKDNLNDFLNINEYNYYLISDYVNTLIDYNSGFAYILNNDEGILVSIDNNLKDNEIMISEKYFQIYQNNQKLVLHGQQLKIVDITKENNYSLIYLNANTFNNFNKNSCLTCLINLKNINSFNNLGEFYINENLFSVSSFEVFDNINRFLKIFSFLLIIEAIVTGFFIFNINFVIKQKEVICLLKLGIYKNVIFKLLLYDPITNIISSVISALISGFVCKYLIAFIYNLLQHSNINISLSLMLIILTIILPFLFIMPLIIIKISIFLKKS